MPFLLTEAALEAHQKELEQEAQPVLLYGASSPRHSPQHHESPPAAKGGFAGFFGSLVSSIGKRGVLGGSKLSAQPSAGCASPLLKAPDVSQFSSFSQGSRLDRFLTDAAKSAIVADSLSSAPSHIENSLPKTQAKTDRSSLAPQAKNAAVTAHDGSDAARRRGLANQASVQIVPPQSLKPPPFKASSSSGNSRLNSASSLSSDEAIHHSSQQLKTSSASALLHASIQVPTLSEIRSRISMLDETRDKPLAHAPGDSATQQQLPEPKQMRPSISQALPAATPVSSSAIVAGSQQLPPYALLQPAPQSAISRSKWRQPSEAMPAVTSQGGWHYRSVKNVSDSPEHQPASQLAAAAATASSTPSWLKVEKPPLQISPASAVSPSVELSTATRSSRRHSLDAASAQLPSPIVSKTAAEFAEAVDFDRPALLESSAAAQRRARHASFVHSQRLSPTKMYAKDLAAIPRQNGETVKDGDALVSVATSSSAALHGSGSHTSPGQVFSHLKVGASDLQANGTALSTNEDVVKSSAVSPGQVVSHTSPGKVFSSLKFGSSNVEAEAHSLSAKAIGEQLSQDLSERLERIQHTHSGQHMQQQKQQLLEHPKMESQPRRAPSLTPSIKFPTASPASTAPAPPSLVSDSLQQFVSTMDVRSNTAAKSQPAARAPSSGSDSAVRALGGKEEPAVKSQYLVSEGADSLEAFVTNQSLSIGSSMPFAPPPAKHSVQVQSNLHKQLHIHDDLHPSEVLPKQAMQTLSTSTSALKTTESKPLQKTSSHSLYRIDSASPPLDNFDDGKHDPPRRVPSRETGDHESDDDFKFDNSWLFRQDELAATAVSHPFDDPLSQKSVNRHTLLDHSSSAHARSSGFEPPPDIPSWLSPNIPKRMSLSKKEDLDDFIGSFSPNSNIDSRIHGNSRVSGALSKYDDFTPSYDVSRIGPSQTSDAQTLENDFAPSFDVSKSFRPVHERNSSEAKSDTFLPRDSHLLAQSARYIARDGQGIQLLASAIRKVHLPNCGPLSDRALKAILTPILRQFDLVAFANKVKVPMLIAADLVQLAPFNIHFLVDDSGDMVKNGTNWNDAQTLLQECVDFVSLVNSHGCTISFLSSSISQAQLKTRDQVASLFARVFSAASSNRFVAKPDVVVAFQSKVFDPIFAGNDPALVYALSLDDSATKRAYLSAEGILRVQLALNSRIAHSNHVPKFVRLSIASVGEGTQRGRSSLLSELRSDAFLSSCMPFIEDFEHDAAVCLEQGVELTPHIYVLKLLLGVIDPNYLD